MEWRLILPLWPLCDARRRRIGLLISRKGSSDAGSLCTSERMHGSNKRSRVWISFKGLAYTADPAPASAGLADLRVN